MPDNLQFKGADRQRRRVMGQAEPGHVTHHHPPRQGRDHVRPRQRGQKEGQHHRHPTLQAFARQDPVHDPLARAIGRDQQMLRLGIGAVAVIAGQHLTVLALDRVGACGMAQATITKPRHPGAGMVPSGARPVTSFQAPDAPPPRPALRCAKHHPRRSGPVG